MSIETVIVFDPGTALGDQWDMAHIKIDKWMRNGFDFYYFYLDRIYRIIRNFFAYGEGWCPGSDQRRGRRSGCGMYRKLAAKGLEARRLGGEKAQSPKEKFHRPDEIRATEI